MNPALAGSLAVAVAITGYGIGWLTVGGAVAGAVVGGVVLAGGGYVGGSLVALFFVSGSLLTRFSSGKRPARSGRQVFANGTCAAIGAALAPTTEAGWPLLAGALTAAQADTWSTEIGRFSRGATRLITTRAVVEPGTSGGVTVRGTVGGVVGAGVMAGLTALLGVDSEAAAAAGLGGVVGFVIDSLLGATLQAKYQCEGCGADTEFKQHSCGASTRAVRGWRWLDNDGVNFVAVGVGGGVALLLWLITQ